MKKATKKAEPMSSTATTAKVEAPVENGKEKAAVKEITPAVKKTTAAKKTAAAPKKTTEKKIVPVVNQEVYIQFWGKEVYAKDVVERIKTLWATELDRKPEELLDLKVYIKPEENGAHYVINGDITGFISL